jgi:hypothetical protein
MALLYCAKSRIEDGGWKIAILDPSSSTFHSRSFIFELKQRLNFITARIERNRIVVSAVSNDANRILALIH